MVTAELLPMGSFKIAGPQGRQGLARPLFTLMWEQSHGTNLLSFQPFRLRICVPTLMSRQAAADSALPGQLGPTLAPGDVRASVRHSIEHDGVKIADSHPTTRTSTPV